MYFNISDSLTKYLFIKYPWVLWWCNWYHILTCKFNHSDSKSVAIMDPETTEKIKDSIENKSPQQIRNSKDPSLSPKATSPTNLTGYEKIRWLLCRKN